MEGLSVNYLKQLKDEFARRCEANPRYSLRAFAKALQFDIGLLSRILNQKHIPSIKAAHRLVGRLDLSPEEQVQFVNSVAQALQRRQSRNASPVNSPAPVHELSLDAFRIIADWYHYALLELSFTRSNSADPRHIARVLGLSSSEAKLALDRLLSLDLIEVIDGKLHKTEVQLTTADKALTAPALRRRQKQILEKSIHSLENDPIEDRNHTAMTMAIDPRKIPHAKAMIQNFTNDLMKYLESGERTRVYELSIGLFPLQIKGERK